MSVKARCLAVLTDAGVALSTSEVAVKAVADRAAVSTALSTLFREGKVQRSKSGGRTARQGSKERIWRVKA